VLLRLLLRLLRLLLLLLLRVLLLLLLLRLRLLLVLLVRPPVRPPVSPPARSRPHARPSIRPPARPLACSPSRPKDCMVGYGGARNDRDLNPTGTQPDCRVAPQTRPARSISPRTDTAAPADGLCGRGVCVVC
jgi:hypothetical protein